MNYNERNILYVKSNVSFAGRYYYSIRTEFMINKIIKSGKEN